MFKTSSISFTGHTTGGSSKTRRFARLFLFFRPHQSRKQERKTRNEIPPEITWDKRTPKLRKRERRVKNKIKFVRGLCGYFPHVSPCFFLITVVVVVVVVIVVFNSLIGIFGWTTRKNKKNPYFNNHIYWACKQQTCRVIYRMKMKLSHMTKSQFQYDHGGNPYFHPFPVSDHASPKNNDARSPQWPIFR